MTACDTAYEGGHVKQWIPATKQEEGEGGIVRYGYGEYIVIKLVHQNLGQALPQ